MSYVISFIYMLIQIISLLVLVKVILSYFMSPYHPVREFIDRLVEPMLAPIRRVMPQTGMLDFSPIVLILILYVIRSLLTGLLRSL